MSDENKPLPMYDRTFRALYDLAVATSGVLDPAALAQLAVAHTRELFALDTAVLYGWDPAAGMLVPLAVSTSEPQYTTRLVPPGQGTIGQAFTRAAPVVVDDYATWEHALPWAVALGIRSSVAVPLLVDTRAVGGLVARGFTPHHFSAADVQLLALVAALVGPALEAARLHGEAQERHAEAQALAEQLREREERYRTLTAAAPIGIFELDPAGQCVYTNARWCAIMGLSEEEALGEGWRAVIHPEEQQALSHAWQAMVRGTGEVDHEMRIRRPDGGERWVHLWATRRTGPDAAFRGVVGTVADITEQKVAEAGLRESEDRLRQSQKMEAVGSLAGGIAHDFNNLLTVINGFSELLIARPDHPGSTAYLHEILQAGQRAATLTAHLLAFGRRQVLRPEVLDLNVVVADMETLLRRIIGEDIALITHLGPDLGPVRADLSQLSQVILNLAANARDAMPTGGELTIESANVELDDAYLERHKLPRSGPHVLLAVHDNGAGMDAETQARAFEPFFTTKPVGKGTGLGLAMVYGIVKQSGGDIWLESEPGVGTTVRIYLPRCESPAPHGQGPASAIPIARGTETILVVEDEDSVRSLACAVLEAHGYAVLAARDGDEALRLMAQRPAGPAGIDLLVTDLVMPGMSGRQLAGHVASVSPMTKVLYMSGYTDEVALRHGLVEASVAFLQKPFGPAVFAQKVREVLDAR